MASRSSAAFQGLSDRRSYVSRQEVGKPKHPRSNSNAYAEASEVIYDHATSPSAAASEGPAVGHESQMSPWYFQAWAPGLLCLCWD